MTEKPKFNVLLPKTDFPMKADLPAREPGWLAQWEKMDLYGKMLARNKGKKAFVLHDGPPYANGRIHVGHALNKVLKDVIVKYKSARGFFAPYVPGWDCHGLPIEHTLMKEKGWTKRTVDRPTFRREAARFADKWVDEQRRDFKRLGVLGDWERPYKTMDPAYEAGIARTFFDLYQKGFITQDKKPVYWCVSCETALAEAEIEYEDKKDASIFIKFPVVTWPSNAEAAKAAKVAGKRASVLVWTTTPWTLPANVALAFHPEQEYRLYENKLTHEFYLVGKPGWAFCQAQFGEAAPAAAVAGLSLEGLLAKNPVNGNDSQGILAEFVSDTDGTGVVHIAPGHGADDYLASRAYGLPVASPVGESGLFTGDVQPQSLKGMHIWKANPEIIAQLDKDHFLVKSQPLEHPYPHCWRCKNPIIFRATEQWFLKVSDALREKLIAATDGVQWIPDYGKERILGMLKTRPDWCLSRQRFWGAPVPMFVDAKTKKPLADPKVFDHVVALFKKHGADVWYEKEAKDLLPPGTPGDWKKEEDILDVWFDSGVSWKSVLGLGDPDADRNPVFAGVAREDVMYLEGSDQHRGWFQTSLLPAVAVTGQPPFGKVLTHGFVLDGQGRAMSKSLGNVIAPQEIQDKYGADIVRLWVSVTDYREDVRLSPDILNRVIDTYRKIRNTLRFLLGNLGDFVPAKHAVPLDKLEFLDAGAMSYLNKAIELAEKHFENFEFHRVANAVADQFFITILSEFYLDVRKDVLYCDAVNSHRRRSAQTVFWHITRAIAKLLAPILSFTAEETWQALKIQGLLAATDEAESVFLNDFPKQVVEQSFPPVETMASLFALRRRINESVEKERQHGAIKGLNDVHVVISRPKNISSINAEDLASMLGVAKITVGKEEDIALVISAEKAAGDKCPRCWVTRELTPGGTCARCADAEKSSVKVPA